MTTTGANEQLRVILVEDSEDDADLVLSELRHGGFDVIAQRVDTPEALQEALASASWDAVLSDHSLPQFSGPGALRAVKASGHDLPFIIVSGSMGEDLAVAAMHAGASDYFIKGQTARLPAALRRALADADARRQRGIAEAALRETEKQLRQIQKMEAVGRLAGGIAHDFNNLLTAILGYSELVLQDLAENSAARADIEEIRNSGQRAAALTRQLLAFSRQQAFELRVLDINGIIVNIEKLLRRLIGADVELVTELDATAGRVYVDPGQTEQVLMNLAINSRDAMPRGGRLTIRTGHLAIETPHALATSVMNPGRYAVVAVLDTGLGMTPDVMNQCLEPFFTTKAAGEGTGLGLSTVYGIVKQSAGHIRMSSEPGRGTTVEIFLPIVQEDEARSARETSGPSALASARGSETILLVDDDEGVRTLLHRGLKNAGYDVLVAGDGVEALALARTHQGIIHLLVTDMVMPRMGGAELVKALTALRPSLPVLFMSGYTDSAEWREAVMQSKPTYLQKPFTPDNLRRKVRELLDAAGGPA